jgi:hypothetical protein
MLPVKIRPGDDCNGLVTGRRPGNFLERQLSDLLSDRALRSGVETYQAALETSAGDQRPTR